MKILIQITCLLVFSSLVSMGQIQTSHENQFPEGIAFSYGYSFYAVKDNFISDEKYSGNANSFALSWSQYHNKNGFRFGIDWLGSDKISNNNVSTRINEFDLSFDYLYPIKRTTNSKKAYLYLGPSLGFFVYTNDPIMSEPGALNMDISLSFMFSGGVVGDLLIPLHEKFQLETSARLNLLSFTIRSVDYVEDEGIDAKLLSVFTGTRFNLGLGFRYFPTEKISLRIAYECDLFWLGQWDPVTSVSDNIVGTVGIHF